MRISDWSSDVCSSDLMPNYLTGIGTVTARRTVTVRTRIDGQLEKIGFKEGQDVKAGQLLAQLDPRTQRAQLDGAKAQKAKDQAQLANAEIDLKRYEKLIRLNAITPQILDTQRATVAQLQDDIQADDATINRKSVVKGKSVSVHVDIGG